MPGSSETVCAQRCGQMSPLPKTPNCRSSGSLLRQRSCEVRIRQESNLRVHVSVCVMMNAEEGTQATDAENHARHAPGCRQLGTAASKNVASYLIAKHVDWTA